MVLPLRLFFRESMKAFSIIILLALAMLPLPGLAQDLTWQKFQSPEGRFSVLLPGRPKEEVTTITTAVGPVAYHYYSVDLQNGFYGVGYSDFPVDPVAVSGLDSVLNGARNGALANMQAKLVSEQNIEIQGQRGRELIMLAYDGKVTLKVRMFVVNSRLFMVMAGTSTRMFISDDLERFFGSFSFDAAIDPLKLESMLKAMGYTTRKNQQGEYEVTLTFSDGRSQTAYIGTDTSSIYGQVVTLWSFVYRTEGKLTDKVSARLFGAGSMKDLGAFYTIRGEKKGTTVIFAARINGASEVTRIQKGIVIVGTVADEMEKELGSADRF
jgi:hypothetical protein